MTRAADLLEGKCRVFDVFVLHGTTLMLPREYRESIGVACEEDILAYVNSQMGDNVYCVDTYNSLLPHNGEYIYFRHRPPLDGARRVVRLCGMGKNGGLGAGAAQRV